MSRKLHLNYFNNSLALPPKPKIAVNRIYFINDRSGSMQRLHSRVTTETKNRIKSIAESDRQSIIDNKKNPEIPIQESYITIVDFSDNSKVVSDSIQAVNFSQYTPYITNGYTALTKTVVDTIDLAEAPKKGISEDEAFLFIIMTDGVENCGGDTSMAISKIIEYGQRANVTLTYIGPRSYWPVRMRFDPENCIYWDGSSSEYAKTQSAQDLGLKSYSKQRASGSVKMSNFYTVSGDKILAQELKPLNPLKPEDFKILTHISGTPIELQAFIQSNNYKFTKGLSYYELITPVRIQEDKDILILDNATGIVYGGGNQGAVLRQALGIPVTGTTLVHPKKSDKYTIFVQSNSHNRKVLSWKDKKTGQIVGQRILVLL